MALKTIKVAPLAHMLLTARARKHNITAGAMLLRLLEDDSVMVPLEPVQRVRWEEAAAARGVSLPQFILLQVESLMDAYGVLKNQENHGETP